MLGFIVAFRPKSKSKNWTEDSMLLQHTLGSICNQTENDFIVFVIFTDMPDIEYDQEKIVFIKFPYELMYQEQLIEYQLKQEPLFNVAKNTKLELDFDKSRRIQFGCERAKEISCNFIMSVDADDLISNKIVAFVNLHKDKPLGWYVEKGYMKRLGHPFFIKVNKQMVNINGSSNIVRADLVPVADFSSTLIEEYAFFHWHAYLRHRLNQEHKKVMKPLPFFAVVYILHDSSLSGYGSFLRTQYLKTALKYLMRGKFITKSLQKEFGFIQN